jgi:hypothetical protein
MIMVTTTQEMTETEGFWSRFKSLFRGNENESEEDVSYEYNRRLLDGRIEKYLDLNLDSYIEEYRILTELDLSAYEDRYSKLTGRISKMSDFMLDADASITRMEKDIRDIKGSMKGRKSKG